MAYIVVKNDKTFTKSSDSKMVLNNGEECHRTRT